MNKNLLANVEGKTPTFLKDNGNKKQGWGVLGLLLLAVFTVFLNGTAWGQEMPLDYVPYYIEGPHNGDGWSDNHYYLCPTENWKYYDATTNSVTNNNTGMPFLTTYQCLDPSTNYATTYGLNKAIWVFEKQSESNYRIKNVGENKYMTSHSAVLSNIGRMRLHLQTTASEGALFTLTDHTTHYRIKANGNVSDGYYYVNVNKGNKPSLVGSGEAVDGINTGGILGTYNKNSGDEHFNFYIRIHPDFVAPTIITVDDNHYTITHPLASQSGFSIRYTTDGSLVPSPNNGTPYTGPIEINSTCTLRAWVVGTLASELDPNVSTSVMSLVASQFVDLGVPLPTFSVLCQNQLEISCPGMEIDSFYYSINDPNPAGAAGTLYTEPFTAGLTDGCDVSAIAYLEGIASNVVTFTYHFNTDDPMVTLNLTTAEISFVTVTGLTTTIYYTTDGTDPDPENVGSGTTIAYTGTSPATITIDPAQDFHLRVIAQLSDRGASCPVTKVARPKWPSIDLQPSCYGAERVHLFSISEIVEGSTYWYALSNGSGQTPPATSAFTQYPLGDGVNIQEIPDWDGSLDVTLHAYVVDGDNNQSVIRSENYNMDYTDAPTISFSGSTVTITAVTGATIHYSVNGVSQPDATTTATYTVTSGQNYTFVATAQYGTQGESCEAVYVITLPQTITTLTQLNNMTVNGAYILGADITGASTYTTKGTDTNPFTGSFDGAGYTISGLTQPLFGTTSGAVIHDVNLKLVNINSSADTVGAIACVAKGYTRIYNCGILPTTKEFPKGSHSVVSATNCAGSIVGSLRDDSRVVNCFSYADVSSSGYVAGIVGNNTIASTAAVSNGRYTKLRTMVVNCMYYGDITGGSNVWPVYGGEKIINGGGRGADISDGYYAINNYNFYSDSCSFPVGKEPSTTHIYNCSWPAKYEYLTRYEFHRYLLNSNRELCGWWVGAPFAPSTMTTTNVKAVPKDATLMAKWVLDRSIAPFPILKPFGYYPSPINIDADATWRESANEWEGKNLGTVTVTVKSGTHHSANPVDTIIAITDMDTLRGDYCYRKIQLPYYNTVFGDREGDTWVEKFAHNYTDSVVTGWKIISVTGGTSGTFIGTSYTSYYTPDSINSGAWEFGFNFADRNCTNKDLYSKSGRVFAQGGYYYVPNGVESIEIEAHWGKAVYLGNGDNYYDRVDFDYLCQKGGNNSTSATLKRQNCPGTAFEPAGTRPSTLGNGQPVHTGKIADVASYIENSGTVYDNALVLVGNHQYCTGNENVSPNRSFTIMSADFDLDNEPDYCLDWQLGMGVMRFAICPIRFDFLPVVEIGLGLKKDGSTQYYSLGCYHPKGHFEVTETALIHFGQFEFSNRRTTECPIILNGGIFDQYVKGTSGAGNAESDKIPYVIIGGNLKMPAFTPGSHVNSQYTFSTRHCAVNVIGGKFDYLYLTGNFNESVKPYADNPHCYIDGGWFSHVAAAGKEGINGDVTWRINHARIKEFYGGGVMSEATGDYYKIVKGSINVVIDNSIVDKYCGGPKFGDMEEDKTVTTSAKGTTFGVYYGAGNGGSNYVQYNSTDGTYYNSNGFDWNGTGQINDYTYGAYRDMATGYQADYEMELINVSTGTFYDCAVNRTYFYAAQFAATNTGTVTNTIDSCTVLTNFYGGGNLGGVNGNVTSTMIDTEVRGSAYGGGFSASIPEVRIYNKDKSYPVIDVYTGIITPSMGGTSTTYTWCYKNFVTNEVVPEGVVPPGDVGTDHPDFQYNNKNYFFTEVPLIDLGKVSGNVSLTIKGNSTIGTVENGVLKEDTGNVFGGGDESAVAGSTTVKLHDKTHVYGDVFGGGNEGRVDGNASVTIEDEP